MYFLCDSVCSDLNICDCLKVPVCLHFYYMLFVSALNDSAHCECFVYMTVCLFENFVWHGFASWQSTSRACKREEQIIQQYVCSSVYVCVHVRTHMCTPLNEQSRFLMFLLTQTRTQSLALSLSFLTCHWGHWTRWEERSDNAPRALNISLSGLPHCPSLYFGSGVVWLSVQVQVSSESGGCHARVPQPYIWSESSSLKCERGL